MATRSTNRKSYFGRSEFTGEHRRNTIAAKDKGAPLDTYERQRLILLTGTEDVLAEPDRRAWLGLAKYPDSDVDFED